VLPPNTQIQANAILALSKSATVFINHLANRYANSSEPKPLGMTKHADPPFRSANEFTLSANKKTIMPADVYKALDEIEFGYMRERVEAEFASRFFHPCPPLILSQLTSPAVEFNEIQTSKRSTYRKKVAAMKKAANTGEGSSMMADASMVSAADETDLPVDHEEDGVGQPRVSKKPRIDPSREDPHVELDDQDHEPSDAETTPEEPEEEEDDEEEVEEEEEEGEEEEAEEDDEGHDGERVARDEDEALDDEDSE